MKKEVKGKDGKMYYLFEKDGKTYVSTLKELRDSFAVGNKHEIDSPSRIGGWYWIRSKVKEEAAVEKQESLPTENKVNKNLSSPPTEKLKEHIKSLILSTEEFLCLLGDKLDILKTFDKDE